MRLVLASTTAACLLLPLSVAAQEPAPGPQPAPGRRLELPSLQQVAIDADPRSRQLALLASQSDLRLRNISAARLPSLTVDSQAQYQSDVPASPFRLPNGQPLFSPSKDTYEANLRVEQRLVDPAIGAQAAVERAQLAEQQARVRTTLYGLRQEVSDAFFAAAALDQRRAVLAAAIEDLGARLRDTTARVREGSALAADAAAVEATLLQRQQEDDELRATRRAALARLGRLVNQSIAEDVALVLPAISDAVARARQGADATRARPEFEQFGRTRERLERQRAAVSAEERPTISAFARAGYGRPGLNFIANAFDSYGVGGIRIQWRAWNWGVGAREREALALQQQVVAADEAAFARTVGRGTEADFAAVDRLQAAIVLDDRIVSLREGIDRSTRLRFDEGIVTAADYVARNTELMQARLARAAHAVELAQAGARLLTTLGLELR